MLFQCQSQQHEMHYQNVYRLYVKLLLYHMRAKQKLGYGQTLKNIVEEQANQEHQQTGDSVDLTPMEHERALKEAYKSFVVPGLPKADVDSYTEKVKPYVKILIEKQLGEMNSAKVISDTVG